MRQGDAVHSLRAGDVDVTELRQLFGREGFGGAEHHMPSVVNVSIPQSGLSGGRSWWAHFEFTRINIEPIILKNKIEEQLIVGASCLL